MFMQFERTDTSAEGIGAMDDSRDVVDSLELGKTRAFIYADAMLTWEGDKVSGQSVVNKNSIV